ncbi:MAG TPA: hypothetical protein VFL95_10620 [Gemmatimonadales bacterium]|nr:hypothetical protein [Gemmatimonadales bacterium]
MSVRTISLAALAAAFPLFTTAPTTGHYRVEQLTIQETDQTAFPGGTKRSDTVRTTGYLVVTLDDSASGRTIHVHLDSILAESSVPELQPALDSLRGTEYHGFMAANGRLTDFHAMTGDTLATDRVEGLVRDLYPSLKLKARQGDQWADTLARTRELPGGQMSVNTVTTYKAAATEQHNGVKALRLDASTAGTLKGEQTTQGQAVQIDGTSSGSGTYYVDPDGRYLGGSRTQDSELHISLAGLPATMPVTIHQQTTITLLK